MKEFCENPLCENPGFKEVPVSVDKPGDQVRTLCATCEEAFSWGVQHGGMSLDLPCLGSFIRSGGFVVLGLNCHDPDPDLPFEAWAYQGPLDFQEAQPVTFGLGTSLLDAVHALEGQIEGRKGCALTSGHRSIRVTVDERELATLLAALRFHQAENLQAGSEIPDHAIREIASDGGRLKPLEFNEVEGLCERLNLPGEPKPCKRRVPNQAGTSSTTTSPSVHPGIQKIHDLLYLDMQGSREFHHLHKVRDADTIAAVAEIVAQYIPKPAQEEKGKDHGETH